MVGIDAYTGLPIEEPEHIKQSISTVLRTPKGSRVMRRDFGFDCLDEQGNSRRGLRRDEVEASARAAMKQFEPRVSYTDGRAELSDDGTLRAVSVRYIEIRTSDAAEVRVTYNRSEAS